MAEEVNDRWTVVVALIACDEQLHAFVLVNCVFLRIMMMVMHKRVQVSI